MVEALISVRNLSKSFPGVRALHGCDFDLRGGEVHAVMGENGAGKSTLMKIIAGVHQPDSGEILVDGRPATIDGPRAAQAMGIGIIHQELNLMPHLSVAANIFIGREPRGRLGVFIDEAKLRKDARALFERLNLALDPDIEVGALSVARQQMVEIAKALSLNSRVLIMDEPTAALTSEESGDLFRIIRQLKAQGIGIIYISHKMDELFAIADRITVLRDGEGVGTVQAAAVTMDEIIQMMVGRRIDQDRRPSVRGETSIALEVIGLNRGRAIRDVSFSARKGEILGLAGLMGAGRTEVARAVFGADPRDSGQIFVHGKEIQIRAPADAVAAGVGYLSEDRKHFGLAIGMDVEANTTMTSLTSYLAAGMFLKKDEMARTTEGYIQKLAIKTPSARQEVRLLSGGNQQKIVVAKWLLRECEVLFFDEPTRGVDVGAKQEIYKLLEDLAAQGRAIIMISSELPEILRMSHRVIVMCEGRVTGELAAADASQEAIMRLATQREI